MRKRKLQKIKEEIKKELKNELHPPEKKEYTPPKDPVLYHDKHELLEIQKSFLIIFVTSIIIVFLAFLFLMIRSRITNDKKETQIEEIVEEQEEYDLTNEPLSVLKDGEVSTYNKNILNLFSEISYQAEEYYLYDSAYLYSKNEFKIEDVSDSYLLFLTSKTDLFDTYIKSFDLLTKAEICNKAGTIRIPVKDLEEMILLKFNRTITNYEDFTYTYYIDRQFSTYIKFVYSDGYYVSSCIEGPKELSYKRNAVSLIEDASKSEDIITIGIRVAFATKEGVYGDYQLENLMTSNLKDDILGYITRADRYELVYNKSDNGYYLQLIKK